MPVAIDLPACNKGCNHGFCTGVYMSAVSAFCRLTWPECGLIRTFCLSFGMAVRAVRAFYQWLPCSVITLAPPFHAWQAYSIYSACKTLVLSDCKLNYWLTFTGFLCYNVHGKFLSDMVFGLWWIHYTISLSYFLLFLGLIILAHTLWAKNSGILL